MKLTITPEKAGKMRKRIKELNLKRPDWFDDLTNECVAKCFNGVGADSTAKPLRKALTYIFAFALLAVLIHDVIWSFVKVKDLTHDDFISSNEDLKDNARTQLKAEKENYSWCYYWWCYAKAWMAQKACNELGEDDWYKETGEKS